MGRNPPDREDRSGDDTRMGEDRTWGLFLAGVSVFMFVLGVLVGRGSAPVTFDIPDMEARIHALLKTVPESAGQDVPELAFFEALKQAEVREPETLPVKTQRFPREKDGIARGAVSLETDALDRQNSSSGQAEGLPGAGASAPVSSVSEVPAGGTKKTESPERGERGKPSVPVEKPASPPPVPQEGAYTIQVAAVKKPEDAALLVRRFRDQGYAAYAVTGTDAEGGVWYRVRVGRFESRDAAGPVLVKLASDQVRGFVLRDE